MKPAFLLLPAAALVLAAGLAAADDGCSGLLSTPLYEPRFAPFLLHPALPPPPEVDAVSLSLVAGTGQVWKGDAGPGGSVGISAQTLGARLDLRWTLFPFLEASLDLPALGHARSFKRRDDPFQVSMTYGSAVLSEADTPGGGFSDPRFAVALFHRDPQGSLRLLRLSGILEFPSRGRRAFESSGRLDAGGFLDLTTRLAGPLFFHGMVGLVSLGDPPGLAGGHAHMDLGIPFRTALELRVGSGFGVHLQLEGANNVLPETGHRRLDEHPVQVTAAVSRAFGGTVRAFLAFSEDVTRGAPDFAVSAGFTCPLP